MLASILKDTNITHLSLEHNYILGTEIEILFSKLRDTKITHLNLQDNQIAEDCAKTLISILKDTEITELILDGNLIDDTGINELISIQENTKIIINFKGQYKEIDNNMTPYDEDNTQLVDTDSNDERRSESGYGGSVCEESDTQDEESCSIPIKIVVSMLQKDPNMTHLNLSNNDIYYKGFKTLVSVLKNTSTTHLVLKHNYINTFVQHHLPSAEECESILKSTKIRIKYLDLGCVIN